MQFRNIIVTLAAFLCIVAALPVSLHATRDELQLARREIDHDLTERGFGDKIINRLASTAKAVGGKNSNWDAITVEPSTLTKKFIEKVKKAVESYFDRNVSGINVKCPDSGGTICKVYLHRPDGSTAGAGAVNPLR